MLEGGNNRLIIASSQNHYYKSHVQHMLNLTAPAWNVEFCQIIRYPNNYSIMQSSLPSFDPLVDSDHVISKRLSRKCLKIHKHNINKT